MGGSCLYARVVGNREGHGPHGAAVSTCSKRIASTREAVKLTIEQALAVPALRGSRILAGQAGRGREICCVDVMEVPD
jgi:hypothetical protein